MKPDFSELALHGKDALRLAWEAFLARKTDQAANHVERLEGIVILMKDALERRK